MADATKSTVSSEDLDRFREDMISRVEALFAEHFMTQCGEDPLRPSNTGLASPKPMSDTNVFHYIEIEGKPISCKARRLAPPKLATAKEQSSQLYKAGVIKPSSSPWASPIHMESRTREQVDFL
ncbi:hypothetical protein TKK_0005590 [Trichogramma kaykai]